MFRVQKIVILLQFCRKPTIIEKESFLSKGNNVETVVLLSKKNMEFQKYVEIGVDAEEYYRIKDK